jgi:hypothetical protein
MNAWRIDITVINNKIRTFQNPQGQKESALYKGIQHSNCFTSLPSARAIGHSTL